MTKSLVARIERLEETARKNEPSDGLVIIRNIVYPGEGHAVLEGMKLPDGGFIARPAEEEEQAFIDRVVALQRRPGCVVRLITQRTPPPRCDNHRPFKTGTCQI